MKKVYLSLTTIALVGALIGGATFAYFSDSETASGNTFTAGTIDISVNNANPWDNIGHFTIADMKPSEVHYKEVTLRNVGTNPADIWKKITVTDYSGGLHPESELGEDPSNDINDIGSVIRYDILINGQIFIDESDNYVIDEGPNQLPATWHADSRYIYLGRLESGAKMGVKQSYHMDGSTTNWAQGDVMTFDVEFYAQQTSGGVPVPGTELPGHGREGTELDAIDIGNSTSMTAHNAQGWMTDTGAGNYGTPPYQRDGGSTIAMTWGESGSCPAGEKSATFDLDAGSNTANKIVVRHLAGITNDSFNVYVGATLVGTYNDVTDSSETWHTTVFNLGGDSFTGKKTIKLEPTVGPWGGCSTWGQGAFNWAKITD